MKSAVTYELLSESHLLLRFCDHITPTILPDIQIATEVAKNVFGPALMDLTPAYTTLLIEFDCLQFPPDQAQQAMQHSLEIKHTAEIKPKAEKPCIEIPVYYHPDVGWDLTSLSTKLALSWQEIALCHQQKNYQVYAMGFAPGFAFMGLLDEKLNMARKSTPRTWVPAGAVAISDLQTAIYPQASPGGWHIIGRSPINLFDASCPIPNMLNTGDTVKFTAISRDEYLKQGGKIEVER
ncbi:MAG: allophanate hydrolase subunit 1 [Pseudomonadales bacterium]|nr:allophanate hydrolase subunit 1 [Pseudomonadales bacterium]